MNSNLIEDVYLHKGRFLRGPKQTLDLNGTVRFIVQRIYPLASNIEFIPFTGLNLFEQGYVSSFLLDVLQSDKTLPRAKYSMISQTTFERMRRDCADFIRARNLTGAGRTPECEADRRAQTRMGASFWVQRQDPLSMIGFPALAISRMPGNYLGLREPTPEEFAARLPWAS